MSICNLPEIDARNALSYPKNQAEFQCSYFVEAGAGAGKTTLIVNRIVSMLMAGEYEPENVAAITFTVKSTQELQHRLDEALKNYVLPSSNQDAARTRLAYLRENLGKMQISTIHNFCSTMLSKMPYHVGLTHILVEDEPSYNGKIKTFFLEKLKQNPTLFDPLAPFYLSGWDLTGFFKNICLVQEVTIPFLPVQNRGAKEDEIHQVACHIHSKLREILDDPQDSVCSSPYYSAMLEPKILAFVQNPNPSKEECLEAMFLLFHLKNSILSENHEDVAKLKENVKEYSKGKGDSIPQEVLDSSLFKAMVNYEEYVATYCPPAMNTQNQVYFLDYIPLVQEYYHSFIVEILLPLREEFLNTMKEAECITHQDSLCLARDLLKHNPDARDYFHRQYRVLFVDEFQDTDPVQTQLLFYLTAKLKPEETLPACWQDCKPREGSLFLVGDPKQSIYRFRGASITNYKAVQDLFAPDDGIGKVVSLQNNYRSAVDVCRFIDLNFNPKAKDSLGNPVIADPIATPPKDSEYFVKTPYQSAYNPMISCYGGNKVGQVIPYCSPGKSATKDPAYVAFLIESMIKGYALPAIYDELDKKAKQAKKSSGVKGAGTGNNHWRQFMDIDQEFEAVAKTHTKKSDYRYSDFLILCLRKADVNPYVDALSARNIPSLSSGKDKYLDSGTVKRGLCHLAMLAYPNDSTHLGHLLQDCYEVELATLRRYMALASGSLRGSLVMNRDKSRDQVLALLTSTVEDEKVAKLCKIGELLEHLLAKSRKQSPMSILEWIFDGPCQVWKSSPLEEREKDYGRVQQFLNEMRQGATGTLVDYYEFAHELNEIDLEYQLPLKNQLNSVRVMNLHKAKGLEARVVFLVSNSNTQYPPEHFLEVEQANLHISVVHNRRFIGIPSNWNEKWNEEEARYLAAEGLRLDYVAATRAQEILYIYGGTANQNNRWARLYSNCDPDLQTAATRMSTALKNHDIPKPSNQSTAPSPLPTADFVDMEATLQKHMKARGLVQRMNISPSRLDKSAPRKKTTEDVAVDEELTPSTQHQPYGADWGTIVHRVMELSVREHEFGAESLYIYAMQAIQETFLTPSLTMKQSKLLFGEEYPQLDEDKRKFLGEQVVASLSFLQKEGDEFMSLLHKAKECYPELSFFTSAEQEDGGLYDHLDQHLKSNSPKAYDVQGYIDLALETEEGWVVVDYKTDKLNQGESPTDYEIRLKEHYQSQISAYALMLNASTGKKVYKNYLCSIPMGGKLIELD